MTDQGKKKIPVRPGAAEAAAQAAEAAIHAARQSAASTTAGAGAQPAAAAAPAQKAAAVSAEEYSAATAQRDEYLDHLRRLQAEFDNYRKRVQRDSESLVLRAGEGVVESLLPVLDNMQRALTAARQHDADLLVDGVELVAGQLRGALESHGLTEVEAAPGVPFDPNVHEAVLTQPSDEHPEGTIAQVLETGYLLHGRLLRPTRVVVVS